MGWTSRTKSERGASAVEFAILLPVLILLVMGTIQFGIFFNRLQGLHAAAREGARTASVGSSRDEIEATVHSAQSLFSKGDLIVDTEPNFDPPCARPGDVVTVNVKVAPTTKYAISIPLFGEYEVNYEASGHYRCERAGDQT